ncbi:MAG: SusC/RagA family TonB-linked outer membrane protein [Bacteroidetes bacterium]|nr:SusC/RagA family TonB-linked outer membrane protein [Bacteroidota bacterium]
MISIKKYMMGVLLFAALMSGERAAAQEKTSDTIVVGRPDEEVNIGYINIPRKRLGASVSELASDSRLKDLASFAPNNMLQGQVAGVRVMPTSATGALLNIRGVSTFNGGTTPLYVVDGVPVKATRFKNSLALNVDNDPLSDIHPEDIASISILKDAQATSIYGMRGGNGVVLITTNQGTAGKTFLDVSAYSGVQFQPDRIQVLDTALYRGVMLDKERASGQSDAAIRNGVGRYLLVSTPADRVERYNNNTKWQDQVLRNSMTDNFHLTLRGGDAGARYALNVGYTGQSGVISNTNFSRFNVRFNLDYKVGRKLSFLNTISYSRTDRKLSDAGNAYNTNPLFLTTVKAPTLAVFQQDTKGADLPYPDSADYAGHNNPYSLISSMINKNNTNRITGKTTGQYIFSPYLSLRVGLSFDYFRLSETRFVPSAGMLPTNYIIRASSRQNSYELMLLNENVLTYKRGLGDGKHSITAFVGNAIQTTSQDSKYGRAVNASSDQLTTVNTSDPLSLDSIGSISPKWNLMSFFASANYAYLDKYLFGVNMRADGSSRFQSSHQWGYFPSASAAWRVSEESFLRGSRLVSDLKLRTSYGLTGNDDVGFTNAFNALVPAPYVYSAVRFGILGDPHFQWEQTRQFDAGLDLQLAKGRFGFTFDFYDKHTDHLYNIILLPGTSGFNNYAVSEGAVTNRGVEASFSWKVLDRAQGRVFGWQTVLNVTYNKNNVTSAPPRLDSVIDYGDYTTVLQRGAALGSFYGYQADGVYARTSDVKVKNGAANSNPFRGGDMIFKDVNGDGIIDGKDRKVIGNVNPKVFGGFTNYFSYGNLDLSVFVDFASGNKIYNARRAALEAMSNYDNQSTSVIWHWRNEGDVTDMPRLANGDPSGNTRFSTRWLEDGSYLRFKSITLGYTFPLKGVFRGVFKSARVLVTGQNLYTFSKYKGYNPDVANFSNPIIYGVDYGNVPPLKAVIFGLQVGL